MTDKPAPIDKCAHCGRPHADHLYVLRPNGEPVAICSTVFELCEQRGEEKGRLHD